jgi:hypothetical protein
MGRSQPIKAFGSIRIQFSADVCYEIPNQAASATVGARFGRAARAANNSFTKFKFNQAWLAES